MTVTVKYEMDGRRFVADEDFLDTFDVDDEVRHDVETDLDQIGNDIVELRTHESLVKGLVDRCLGKTTSLYAPVVTKEWVFWVSAGRHQALLSMLARLYSNGEAVYGDYILREGLGWQISSESPSTIFVGFDYEPTLEDKEIFRAFSVKKLFQK